MNQPGQNYFELLSLPISFHQDKSEINSRSQSLLNEWHPDRFVGGDDRQRRHSAQMTSLINEAKTTLVNRLSRAGYLLRLQNEDPDSHKQSDLDPEFLFKQMQLRDAVEQAESSDDEAELATLKADVKNDLEDKYQAFEQAWKSSSISEARKIFHQLQFIEKLLTEINQSEERLLDY